MNNISVLIATGTMNAGGAESLIMEMLRRKSKRIQYTMLIHYTDKIEKGVYDDEIRSMNIPIEYIPSVGSIGIKHYILEFEKVIRKIGSVDILHSHLNAVGGVIAKAAKKVGIPSRIVHCHADITFTGNKINVIKNEIKLALMKVYVNRYANHFWGCSENALRRLFRKNKNGKIIPNVIYVKDYLMTEEKRSQAKNKYQMEGHLVLGSVGRIARIKNYEFVLKVLKELKDRGRQVDFICFGRVTDEAYFFELCGLADKLGVTENVHFKGNSTNISFDLGCFDLFIMPSKSEGFGMAAIEAQAAGLPTIVSTGVPELIDIGAGLVTFLSIEDERKWADVIEEMKMMKIENDIILSYFDNKGFNSETMVRSIEEEYLAMSARSKENGCKR